MAYLVLAICWIVWCTLHSTMVSLRVTEALRRRFPHGFRYHRIAYNLFAVLTLLPVLTYSLSLEGETVIAWSGPWRIVPIGLGLLALVLFLSGARRYDLRQLLGLRQLQDQNACSVLTDDCSFDTGGVLSVVRHPWYCGGILTVWARPLDTAAILTNLILCGYFVVGAILEERKLIVQFGQQYKDYQNRVSMLFPIKWAGKVLFGRD